MLTIDQLTHATGASAQNANKFLPFIVSTFDKFQINTPIRQLSFLAQVGTESGGLFFTEELASGEDYEGRVALGNTHPGDGVKYKGRGLIQITGRTNYQALTAFFNVDFINNPSLLAGKNTNLSTPDQLKYAALSAGWFWNSRQLNSIADQINLQVPLDESENMQEYILITKRINGGTNGLADRVRRFNEGRPFFINA
jgi:putative chitinase